ncbi:hypothetical protein PMAYCL1PPCAC_00446, partial [Pristionchus mayeri]
MKILQKYGDEYMQDLRTIFGNIKMCCFWCNLTFDDNAEFYIHLRTSMHLHKADPFDYITLVVNFHYAKFDREERASAMLLAAGLPKNWKPLPFTAQQQKYVFEQEAKAKEEEELRRGIAKKRKEEEE